MVQDDMLGGQKPRGPWPENTSLLLIIGIAGAIILAGAVAAVIVFWPQPDAGPGPVAAGPAVTVDGVAAGPGAGAPVAPDMNSRQGTLQPTPEPTKKPVDFRLEPGDLVNCGLTCRQLTAAITNTGDETAHSVCISLSIHNSRGDVIGLNGGSSLQQCIGSLAGGETRREPVMINADCGAFATRCIGETLTLETEVTSEERTVRFPDQQIAV